MRYGILSLFVALLVVSACSNDRFLSGDGSGGGLSSLYSDSRLKQIKIDPTATVEMLYQGILWRSQDPGSIGYINYVRNKGVPGIKDAGVGLTHSLEFLTKIHSRKSSADLLNHFTSVFIDGASSVLTSKERSDYLLWIQRGEEDKVVKALLTHWRFYEKMIRLQKNSGAGATPDPGGSVVITLPPPTGIPGGFCSLPAMPDHGNCPREGDPKFLNDVEAAIDQVLRTRPDLFDFNDSIFTDTYRILNLDGYLDGVVSALQSKGYCAARGGDEIGVKNQNGFNEQYHIDATSGYMRRGTGSYRSTCYPAAF